MQVDIERSTLLKGLAHAQSVVEKRNTVPILANVMLQAEGDVLILTATDLDMEIRLNLAARVTSNGSVTVPAHMFYDIVRKLPDGAQVALRHVVDESRLQIIAGRARFALPVLDAVDFPLMSFADSTQTLSMASSVWQRLIDKTRFAISTEEARYYLNGIYLHIFTPPEGEPLVRAVATDGHRLAQCDFLAPSNVGTIPGIIIPRKAVAELRKVLEEDATADVLIADTKIRVRCGDITLTSKLIDGTFPDYTRVTRVAEKQTLTVNANALAQTVDRVSTISTDKVAGVKLHLRAQRLEVEAGAGSGALGSGRDELEADYTGEEIDIAFNARFLTEILHHIEGENALMGLNDAHTQVLLRDDSDANVLYVLMPIRV